MTLHSSQGHVLWIMGPTSSGKTTLATSFLQSWREEGRPVIHYDGDEVRDFFGASHGFKPEDRQRVVETLILLANKASEAGILCIVSALTAHEDARKLIVDQIPTLKVAYVDCTIEECARRDPKGLYARAKSGEIDTLIGWNTPYIPPSSPDIILNTQKYQPNQLFERVSKMLKL